MNMTLVGQLTTFAVLAWFTHRFVWGPVTSMLEERRKRIAEGLAAAERGHHERELAEKHAKELLANTKEQAKEIIAQAHRRADEIIDEAKRDAREEGNRLVVAARAEIDQVMNRAREDLREEVVKLALEGAEQVLMREVDRKAHTKVLEKLARRLSPGDQS